LNRRPLTMLHMLYQLLKSVKKWAFEFEHDVDFVQRINRERSANTDWHKINSQGTD
jgi:hypothetical protein